MKNIIIDGVVLSCPLEGPLAAHIGSFATRVDELGYRLCSIHGQVLTAARFSRWLGRKGVRLRRVSLEHVERYLRYRRRRVRVRRGDAAGLRQLIEFLRREGVVSGKKVALRGRLELSDARRNTNNTYAKNESWQRPPSSTMSRLSDASSKTVSAMERSSCRACLRATSSGLFSAKRADCARKERSC